LTATAAKARVLDEMAATYKNKNVPFGQILVKFRGEPNFCSHPEGPKDPQIIRFLNVPRQKSTIVDLDSYPQVVYWAELAFIHDSIT